MGRIHTPRWPNRLIKPAYGSVEIDWGHPLAQGLVSLHLLNDGSSTPYDLARGVTSTKTDGSWIVRPTGMAARDLVMTTTMINEAPQAFTCVAYCEMGGPAANWPGGSIRKDAVDGWYYDYAISSDTGNHRTQVCVGGSWSDVVYGSAIPARDYPVLRACSWDGTTVRLWQNGVADGSTIKAGSRNLGSVVFTTSAYQGDTQTQGVRLYWYGIWSYALSNDAHLALRAEPYCFLQDTARRSYGFLSGGAPPSGTWPGWIGAGWQ